MEKTIVPLYLDPIAFTASNVMSQEECRNLIQSCEEEGFSPNKLNVGKGNEILSPNYLDSYRCILMDSKLANQIWERIGSFIPQQLNSFGRNKLMEVVGIHDRLRVLRYPNTQRFDAHLDASEERERNGTKEKSLLSVLLYLNEGFDGGGTSFEEPGGKSVKVVPRGGMALIFEHELVHSGEAVGNGVKYVA
eukprot:TRINITY_DN4692_c0_g1_i1.p1 TRINITY_DN4692_c0_g1~~TRINITY_DN4692_c0_g1_i1.p1  ORF type:complete len:204 (+),score=42.19 TRINITY_DN4692_c0_g1_i1:39-614(+)